MRKNKTTETEKEKFFTSNEVLSLLESMNDRIQRIIKIGKKNQQYGTAGGGGIKSEK